MWRRPKQHDSHPIAMEREWVLPAVAVTLLSAGTALAFIPDMTGLLPAMKILPAWMALAALIAAIGGFAVLAVRRVESPFEALREAARTHRRRIAFVTAAMLLAGANMIAFMWIKPLLNYLVPFWADPMLAQWDHALFLGHDPWRLLAPLNFAKAGIVYHQVWFAMMIGTLLLVSVQRPSPEKSAIMLSYFLLWSLVGPLIHIALPATGPIFFERMGYGNRFAGLDGGAETTAVGDYLWAIYATKSFGAGSGISAMPSMHVTMVAWIVIASAIYARKWLAPVLAAAGLIFVLSISLGWHYALDGIVGAAAAAATYLTLRQIFRVRANRTDQAQIDPLPA